MQKFFDLGNIFSICEKAIKIVSILLITFLIFGLIQSLFLSPIDYIQGHSVRIMYVHVPSSWIALLSFGVIGFLSILNFIFRNKNFGLIGKTIAPIGLMFTLISIFTGSLWGKPTWGVWWVWDARITSMLVLCFFYLLYIFSWKFISNHSANKISSLIAIFGLINLPIIKFSVDWWNTLHQTSSVKILSTSTIHHSMMVPLLAMFLALSLYSVLIFLMKYKTEIIRLKRKGLNRI